MPLSKPGRAVILPQRGTVPIIKQINICLGFVDGARWPLAAIGMADRPQDVVEMIRAGDADIVVVAYGGQDLAVDVEKANGRVVAVHPTPHVVAARHPILRSVADLVGRLFAKGHRPQEIARLLDENTGNIEEILRLRRKD